MASAAAASAEAASATEAFGPWGVCYRSLGRVGQLAAVGAMVVGQLGVGIVYTDYIATFLQSYALSFRAWVALLFVANSALCLARPLGAVSYISGLGCLVYVYVLALLFYYAAAEIEEAGGVPSSVALGGSLSGLGSFFGLALFSMEGVSTLLTLFDGMGGRDVNAIRRVVSANYLVVMPLLLAVGLAGYAAWGESVASDVLYSFPSGTLADSAIIAIGVVLALTYPIQVAPVFEVFEAVLPARFAPCWPLVRISLVGLTAAGAVLIPNVTTVMSLTADVAFSFIAFIGPGLLYLRLRPLIDSPPPAEEGSLMPSDAFDVAMSVVAIVVGTVGGVYGVVDTLS